MTITIADASGNVTEFYGVPHKVAKAIISLLHEYKIDDINIISAESEE